MEQELEDLEREIPRELQKTGPGRKLQRLLQQWTAEEYYQGDPNFPEYRDALWRTRAEFEQDLQRDSLKLERLRNEDFYHMTHTIGNIKDKSQLYIQGLELALNESQLRGRNEIETLNMTIAEIREEQQ